jgi:hypothetical protein
MNIDITARHLYGDAHRFSMRPRVGGGTIVAIQIPYRESASARGEMEREIPRDTIEVAL